MLVKSLLCILLILLVSVDESVGGVEWKLGKWWQKQTRVITTLQFSSRNSCSNGENEMERESN